MPFSTGMLAEKHHCLLWITVWAVVKKPGTVLLNIATTLLVYIASVTGQHKILEAVSTLLTTRLLVVELPVALVI